MFYKYINNSNMKISSFFFILLYMYNNNEINLGYYK